MNRQTIFANLRDALAALYTDQASTQRVVDDAGLDVRLIAFTGQASNNWHTILSEAVKKGKTDDLLQVALGTYRTNPALQAAYTAYRDFIDRGGDFGPVVAKPCTTGLPDRAAELAYLKELATRYQYWAEKYTPLAGIAEVQTASTGPQLDLPEPFMPAEFEKLVEHGFGPQRQVERVPVTDLCEAVTRYQRLVLLGNPGSGKTTTLWRLVYDYTQAALADDQAPLPLLVPLSGYSGPEPALDYLQTYFGGLAPYLATYLQDQRVILLLDALNEMPQRDYGARVQRLQKLLNEFPDIAVIITCRALDYVEALNLEKLDIRPLDPDRQLAYLQRYLGAIAGEKLFWQLTGDGVAELWQTWQRAGGTWAQFWTAKQMPEAIRRVTTSAQDRLWAALRRQECPPLLALGTNPYLLLMLAHIYAAGQGALPQNRGRLFAAFVDTLLGREEKRCDPAHWPGAPQLKVGLAHLAYAMQIASERGTAVDTTWAVKQMTDAGHEAMNLLYWATSATLLENSNGQVRFVHQLLQEYFTALALQAKLQANIEWRHYWPEEWTKPTGWEEIMVMLAGILADMTPLIDKLHSANPPLAALCLVESGGLQPSEPKIQTVQSTLVRLVTGLAVPLRQRNIAGNALNYLGDPRPGVGLTSNGLLDIVWCQVPSGEFIMGNTKRTDELADGDEVPQHSLTLITFAISQYLITNTQFAAFVQDGGYTIKWRHCWTEAGWQWRTEAGHTKPLSFYGVSTLSNHPVVGVSWYEAIAFCYWLSEKLGQMITLPTEAQWEKAARGTNGQRYPWGEAFTLDCANYSASDIGSTSAVGLFPKGASPYGILDMAGNVWEWTRSRFKEYPYSADDGREDLETKYARAVRGGSFFSNMDLVRCAARYYYFPDASSINIGFRVVSSVF